MKELKKLILQVLSLLVLVALLVSFVRADIIGSDAGGSGGISVNPNEYSDNPFTGPEGEAGAPAPPGGEEEGGGGGGGGGRGVVVAYNLSVSPAEFDMYMLISTNVRDTLTIQNLGTTTRAVTITQSGLDSLVIIENATLTLTAGQTKEAGLIFVAPDTEGVYNGTIYVGGIAIPVTLRVLEEFVLFDSNIVVLNDDYQVPQGEPLMTEVTLIQMGGPLRMDVTLNYVIKDANGTVFLTRSETLLVEGQKSIRRDFDTGGLPLGRYVIELELIYPFGVAPSSAHFDIIESLSDVFSLIAYWIMFMIIVILIILIIIAILRTIRKMQNNRTVNSEPVASVY